MKVLFTFGGLPHYYNKVLNRLHQQPGIEVVVVAPTEVGATLGAGVEQSQEDIQFRVIRLPERRRWWGKVFFDRLPETLATEKPDIVVTVWPYILGFLFVPNLKKHLRRADIKLLFKDIPFLLAPYGQSVAYYSQPHILRTNEDRSLPRVDWRFRLRMRFLEWARKQYYSRLIDAHVNYVEGAEHVLATYGVSPQSVFVTYNSPDTDELLDTAQRIPQLPPLLPPNPHRLIHVGRLVKWKRVDLLIDALALVRQQIPQAELVVVGTGPEKKNLEAQATQLGVADAVRFVGSVYAPADLGRYLHESAVYVLAGMGGLSINEAMAFAKPIVCSVCDGTEKHLVRPGHNGYFFEEDNARDLAQKLTLLLQQPLLCAQMGAASQEIVRTQINIHTVVQGYLRAFAYLRPEWATDNGRA